MIGAQRAVHAAPGADEPGHPGHLLRPAGRRHDTDDRVAARRCCRRATPASRSSSCGRLAVDQGDARLATCVHLTARYDERTGTVIAIAAIDNLAKGASGGAVQCANVALGLPRPPACRRSGCTRDHDRAAPQPRRRRSSRRCPYIRRFCGQDRRREVRRQRHGRRTTRLRSTLFAAGHRADALGRHAPGRRARRRPADQRADARLGKEPEFRDGLRVTDAETVDIARMVLVGKVNREIVSAINVHGPLRRRPVAARTPG